MSLPRNNLYLLLICFSILLVFIIYLNNVSAYSYESMFTPDYYHKKYPSLSKKRDDYANIREIFAPILEPFIIGYNNIVIENHDHKPLIFFDDEDRQDAESLVDYLSFIFHKPTFILTENKKLDAYLCGVYESSISFEELEIFTPLQSRDEIVFISEINHPLLLALYNTAMKQPEPLARCVFLFRIIECYFKINNVTDRKECVTNLYKIALNYNFIPINVVGLVRKNPECEYSIERVSRDLIDEWKDKSKKIYLEWEHNSKDLFSQIYNKARCGVAHANRMDSLILHDYSADYKFITDVNFFLELISRYIIEYYNPIFRNYINFDKNIKRLTTIFES